MRVSNRTATTSPRAPTSRPWPGSPIHDATVPASPPTTLVTTADSTMATPSVTSTPRSRALVSAKLPVDACNRKRLRIPVRSAPTQPSPA